MFTVRLKITTGMFLLVTSLAFSTATFSRPRNSSQDSQSQADNTKKNRDQSSPTADKQQMNSSDRETAQKIRKSIMADKSLSTYAHNVKVISQNGQVTLRGPVRSDEEKANVEGKAAEVVGRGNVRNQIEVAPSK
jgi:osmotically-inducible protein OsmY